MRARAGVQNRCLGYYTRGSFDSARPFEQRCRDHWLSRISLAHTQRGRCLDTRPVMLCRVGGQLCPRARSLAASPNAHGEEEGARSWPQVVVYLPRRAQVHRSLTRFERVYVAASSARRGCAEFQVAGTPSHARAGHGRSCESDRPTPSRQRTKDWVPSGAAGAALRGCLPFRGRSGGVPGSRRRPATSRTTGLAALVRAEPRGRPQQRLPHDISLFCSRAAPENAPTRLRMVGETVLKFLSRRRRAFLACCGPRLL